MPDPNTPQVPSQSAGWFADAPGGDFSLDELFPNPDVTPQAPTQAPSQPVPQAQPTPSEPFLQAPSGTVYRSREDAIKGISEKDSFIQRLRTENEALKAQVPKPPEPTAPRTYREAPEKLFDDLVEAANKGDKRRYAETLARYNEELMAPYAPLVSEAAHEKAIRELEATTPDVRAFVNGPDFRSTMEALPRLAQAIEFARNTVEASGQLTELYRLAYLANAGAKAPELVRSAVQQSQPTPGFNRPTLQPSSPTPTPGPAAPSGNWTELLQSREGRKAIIEQGNARGLGGVEWGKVGL